MYPLETAVQTFSWHLLLVGAALLVFRYFSSKRKLYPKESRPNFRVIFATLAVLIFVLEMYKVTKDTDKNYFELLQVPRTATPAEVKSAFRHASMTAHPDKGGSNERFNAINIAQEVLSDPERKEYYDTFGPSVLRQCEKSKCSSRSDYISVYYIDTLFAKLATALFSVLVLVSSKYVRVFSWTIGLLFAGVLAVEGLIVASKNELKETAQSTPLFETVISMYRYYTVAVIAITICSHFAGYDVRTDREILRDIELQQQEFILKVNATVDDLRKKIK